MTRKQAWGEALPLHRRAYEISDGLLEYGLCYNHALQRAGFPRKALDMALEMHERFPDSEPLSVRIAQLHFVTGSLDRAIEQAAAALDSAPSGDRYASALAHYHALLRRRRARHPLRRARRFLANLVRSFG